MNMVGLLRLMVNIPATAHLRLHRIIGREFDMSIMGKPAQIVPKRVHILTEYPLIRKAQLQRTGNCYYTLTER